MEKQEKFSEDSLTCKTMQKEFDQSMKEDTKYKNEDSAKKRAVEQGKYYLYIGMDYDNFHQMVLGANLKPIKKGDFININSQTKALNLITKNSNPEVEVPEIQITEEKYIKPGNQDEFYKYITKVLKTPEEQFKLTI